MKWSSEAYWLKAKLYSDRAHDAGDGEADFPFFCALALEFLARAALADIHPALLADAKDDASLLYAFGFAAKTQPKTADMRIVIQRLEVILPDFGTAYSKGCLTIVFRRNEELHSGDPAFANLKESEWLATYYGAAEMLCKHMGKTLADLVGSDAANTATGIIAAARRDKESAVRRKISSHRDVFLGKPEPERTKLIADSKGLAGQLVDPPNAGQGRTRQPCPSCGASAWKRGALVSETAPILEQGAPHVTKTYLTDYFVCRTCNLRLDTSEEIALAGIEPRFSRTEEYEYESEQDEPPYMDM